MTELLLVVLGSAIASLLGFWKQLKKEKEQFDYTKLATTLIVGIAAWVVGSNIPFEPEIANDIKDVLMGLGAATGAYNALKGVGITMPEKK